MRLLAILASLLLLAAPVAAQDGPNGMAYVQAPGDGRRRGFGVEQRRPSTAPSRNASPTQASKRPTALVGEDGGCSPSRWSADIFVPTRGAALARCARGWSSREKLEEAAEVIAPDYFAACEIVVIWDPDGKEIDLGA